MKDEKLPAVLDNPDHKDKTTVEYRSGIESSGMKWTTKEPPTKNHPKGQDITYERPEGFKSKFISTIDSARPDIGEQRKLYSWENLSKQSGTVKLSKSLPRAALDSTRVGYRSLRQKR